MSVRPSTEGHLAALTARLPEGYAIPVVAKTLEGFRIVASAGRGDVGGALDTVERLSHDHDVYVGTTAMTLDNVERLQRARRRGGKADAAAVVAVYSDLDVAGPAHKSDKRLPESAEEARSFLAALPEPSLLIGTGNGLHAWWLLDEPLLLDSDEARQKGAALVDDWVRTVAHHAARTGREVDENIGTLDRILRLCGTSNHKSEPPRPVTIEDVGAWPAGGLLGDGWAWSPGAVYPLGELRSYLDPLPRPQQAAQASRTQAPRPSLSGELTPLDAFEPVPWSEIWPGDWERRKDRRVDGELVEAWRRPGASSEYSAVCWPRFCHVHSDAVGWLSAGSHTKAAVYAARYGVSASELARETSRAASRMKAGAR